MKKFERRAGGQPATGPALMRFGRLCVALGLAMRTTAANAALFDGPYVGADVGYEDSGRIDHGGATYGGFAGYDLRVGSDLVLGAEGRIGGSSITETRTRSTSAFTTVARSSIGRHVGASARLGFLAGPRTLVYARAGWENVKVNATTTRTPVLPAADPTPIVTDFSFDDDTSVFGLGVEHAVHDKLRLRVGYDYAENFDRHQLRVGVVAAF
jgi:outer membrane immunogenic protein